MLPPLLVPDVVREGGTGVGIPGERTRRPRYGARTLDRRIGRLSVKLDTSPMADGSPRRHNPVSRGREGWISRLKDSDQR
jgi:hypothetical protein